MTDDKHSPLDGDAVDPAGEQLADDLNDPGDYEIAVDETEAEELVDAVDEVDDTPDQGDPEDVVIDDPSQLAAAESVAAKARSSRPVKRKAAETAPTASKAVAKSSGAKTTRKTKVRPAAAKQRTTPALFVNQSVGELKKVNWPTGDQLRQYFVVVLVFVVLLIGFVGLLDLGFGKLLLELLGGSTTPPQ